MANENEAGGAPAVDEPKPGTEGQPPEGQEPEGQEGEEDNEPPSIEALAQELGWTPKDKFKGPEDQWKPADEFIRAGRDIQRSYASDIKRLSSQLDVMSRTTADILKDRLEEQKAELIEAYNQKVEEGDAAGAFKIGQRLTEIDTRAATAPSADIPTSEGQEFAQRHAKWFNVDAAATARARQICNDLAAQGVRDPAAQLRAAERTIRLEYPEHFEGQQNGQARQRPATVNNPGGRGSPPSNRAKGFSDMPKAAQDVAKGMVERGVIPNTEAYVKRYWQNEEGKR